MMIDEGVADMFTNKQEQEEAIANALQEMKDTAKQMRDIIVAMPPLDLLGYIYNELFLQATHIKDQSIDEHSENNSSKTQTETFQFLLEYVHAVLASDLPPKKMKFDESKYVELLELAESLFYQSMGFSILSSHNNTDGIFGSGTGRIEMQTKTKWIMLRGDRYPVLEEEFYRYVLAPHDEILKEVYGVGAEEIAAGFQAIANSMRSGHDASMMKIDEYMQECMQETGQENIKDATMKEWIKNNPEKSRDASLARDDLFRAGIANVSRQTNLPPALLADLAYKRGEEKDFFTKGKYAGTPYNTLPVRRKPLIQIDEDYYAVDYYFARDNGYRTLLYNLVNHRPEYKENIREQQQAMSEKVFADILADQLPNAKIFNEVYYYDDAVKDWCETDALIAIDDVLFVIEAKAGAAASIASPVVDFVRHAQSIKDLILKAYTQCERFFNYLNSADEVSIFDNKHKECGRIRRSDYRLMIPIGLTVETFSPFSSNAKELPEVKPLLGKHPFISLSIDDLFVLRRFLPTPGQFAHYMEVRQDSARIHGSFLMDEIDHLGMYIQKNRFDFTIADAMNNNNANMLVGGGVSEIIDQSFEGKNWKSRPFPNQKFPAKVQNLLTALDTTREKNWLSAESRIRDLSPEKRQELQNMLRGGYKSLKKDFSYNCSLSLKDNSTFFIWLQKGHSKTNWQKVKNIAIAAGLSAKWQGVKESNILGIIAKVKADGTYHSAEAFTVDVPTEETPENAHIFEAAKLQLHRTKSLDRTKPIRHNKPGRNDPCPCGSSKKYKKCCGP